MLEKIKQYAALVFGAIAAILLAIVYALGNKINGLNSKIGQLEADKQLQDVVNKKNEAEKQANDEEAKYHAMRNEYDSDSDKGSSGSNV